MELVGSNPPLFGLPFSRRRLRLPWDVKVAVEEAAKFNRYQEVLKLELEPYATRPTLMVLRRFEPNKWDNMFFSSTFWMATKHGNPRPTPFEDVEELKVDKPLGRKMEPTHRKQKKFSQEMPRIKEGRSWFPFPHFWVVSSVATVGFGWIWPLHFGSLRGFIPTACKVGGPRAVPLGFGSVHSTVPQKLDKRTFKTCIVTRVFFWFPMVSFHVFSFILFYMFFKSNKR